MSSFGSYVREMYVTRLSNTTKAFASKVAAELRFEVSWHLPFPIETVWELVSDMNYFFTDRYHRNLNWLTEAQRGKGAEFEVDHAQFRFSGFKDERVHAEITHWDDQNPDRKEVRVNERFLEQGFLDHIQRFRLERVGSGTRLSCRSWANQMVSSQTWSDFSAARRARIVAETWWGNRRLIVDKKNRLLQRLQSI